jgi:hypothetical protein
MSEGKRVTKDDDRAIRRAAAEAAAAEAKRRGLNATIVDSESVATRAQQLLNDWVSLMPKMEPNKDGASRFRNQKIAVPEALALFAAAHRLQEDLAGFLGLIGSQSKGDNVVDLAGEAIRALRVREEHTPHVEDLLSAVVAEREGQVDNTEEFGN